MTLEEVTLEEVGQRRSSMSASFCIQLLLVFVVALHRICAFDIHKIGHASKVRFALQSFQPRVAPCDSHDVKLVKLNWSTKQMAFCVDDFATLPGP